MIVVVTGCFEEYDIFGHKTGKKKFGVSHGYNMDDGNCVPLENVDHPKELGAKFDNEIGEWVIV